jgi:hypothetical protein
MPPKQKLSNIDMKKELKEFKKGDIFEKQITYLLYPEEKALYSFCKKILQNKFATSPDGKSYNYYDIFITSCPINKPSKKLTKIQLLIFLNFLRFYNPPKHNIQNDNYNIILLYTEILFSNYRGFDLSLSYDLSNIEVSLLFKFINEIAYEKASLEYYPDRNYNYISHGSNNLIVFKDKLSSSVFEEIIFKLIPEALYSIHLPQAGDILLKNNTTLEIKKNNNSASLFQKFITSSKKAKRNNIDLLSGISGGNRIPNNERGKVFLSYKKYDFTIINDRIPLNKEVIVRNNFIINNGTNIASINDVFIVTEHTEDVTEIYRNMIDDFRFAYGVSGIRNNHIHIIPNLKDLLSNDNNIGNYIKFHYIVGKINKRKTNKKKLNKTKKTKKKLNKKKK